MIVDIIVCTLLFVVSVLLSIIGYMLYKFIFTGVSMKDAKGRYMTDVDINALVSARERAIREAMELNKEYKMNNVPLMGESSLNQGQPLMRSNRKTNDLIPYGLSDADRELLEEFYK
jgi:hypothetical protein